MLQSAFVLAAAALVLGACGGSPQPAVTYARYQFTCCMASDVSRTWQPGETLLVHWIVNESRPTPDPTPHQVKLKAELPGAYADVGPLKSRAPVARKLRAPTITIDDRTAAAPTSTIALPPDLPPGLYNLAIEVDFGGENRMSAASVIRIGSAVA